MKNKIANLLGGLAGALTLNAIHQLVKQFDRDAPRVDLVGEEALTKTLHQLKIPAPTGDQLFALTLAGDIVSNSIYYSGIGLAKTGHLPLVGAITGATAGLGALSLTSKMGLNDEPITHSQKTKVLTVAWYTIGGLVAGLAIRSLRK